MNSNLELAGQERRVTGKQVERLRREGFVPAVLYGQDVPSLALQVEWEELKRLLKRAGSTGLIQLKVGREKPQTVLIKNLQYHPVTGNVVHVDFYRVVEREKLRAAVPLRFVGEAPVTKTHDVAIVRPMNEVQVACYPSDLPQAVEVDLTTLTDVHSTISVGDLSVGDRVAFASSPGEVVASVAVSSREAIAAEQAAAEAAETEEEREEEHREAA